MTTVLDQFAALDTEALFILDNLALGLNGTTVIANNEASAGSMGVSNLLSPALDTAYRSGSFAVTSSFNGILKITFNLSRGRTVNTVALAGSNVRLPWAIRLYRFDPALGSEPDYRSSWTNPIILGRMGDYTWRDMPWTLGPSSDSLSLWTSEFRLRSLIQADRDYYGVQWVQVLLDTRDEDYSRFQGDYAQIASVFIARSFQPRINLLLDWDLGIDDLSEIHRSEAGVLLGRHRAKLGTMSFTLGYVERFEGFRRILSDWMKKHGKLGRIFVWAEPDQPAYFYDQSMICTAETLPKVAMANLDWPAAKGWLLKETE